jgi:hypothetical protein
MLVGSDGPLTLETYQKMEPALQLSTLLLQRACPFLMRLMFARVLPNGVLDEAYQADRDQEIQNEMKMSRLAHTVPIGTSDPWEHG